VVPTASPAGALGTADVALLLGMAAAVGGTTVHVLAVGEGTSACASAVCVGTAACVSTEGATVGKGT